MDAKATDLTETPARRGARQPFDAADYWERRLRRDGTLKITGMSGLSLSWNRWIYLLRRTIFHRALADTDLDPRRAKVLDIGCGVGFYIRRWRVEGATDITGVDISRSAVERLSRELPKDTFLQADASEGLTHVGTDFDAVSMFDVVYHIVDEDKYHATFHNIYEVLKPGGWLLFSENFVHRPTKRGRHFIPRNKGETEDAVRAAGFQIVHRRPMFVLMNLPVDRRHEWEMTLWRKVAPWLKKEPVGMALGAALYPVDRVLTKVRRESPTTEVMVARKPLHRAG